MKFAELVETSKRMAATRSRLNKAGYLATLLGQATLDEVPLIVSYLSGVIPQVAAIMGPTAAGTSYIPALADFVPMVKGIGTMALAGPTLVKAAVGEDIDYESLGGAKVHCEVSGVGHLECPDDKSCIQSVKDYLSYLPSNYRSSIPMEKKPVSRLSEEIFKIIPDSNRKAYNMKKVIEWLADKNVIYKGDDI